MKKLLTILTLTALAALPATTFAAAKKEAAPAATPAPAPAPKAAEPKAAKPMAMYSEVTSIDAAGKSFTHKNKDGKDVKFVITDKTEIKNGDAAAKFEDIKVGDYVSGSRLKKSETEYEVIKITKFGAKTEKKAAAPAPGTPAAKATPAPKKAS